jgi:hypothetical protein
VVIFVREIEKRRRAETLSAEAVTPSDAETGPIQLQAISPAGAQS